MCSVESPRARSLPTCLIQAANAHAACRARQQHAALRLEVRSRPKPCLGRAEGRGLQRDEVRGLERGLLRDEERALLRAEDKGEERSPAENLERGEERRLDTDEERSLE